MRSAMLSILLDHLLAAWESEVVEFKEAARDFDTSDIGRYFSALANEANLRGMERGWLIFGVKDSTRSVVGTGYRLETERLQSLKQQMHNGIAPPMTFREIHELQHPLGRIVLLEVPAAPRGMPVAWNGHYYARAGESLTALGVDKLDAIRAQTSEQDWTAQVISEASLADLDGAAVQKARQSFAKKWANRFAAHEVAAWPLDVFLDRARLTQGGFITRTALLLLGKLESAYRLSPHPGQMTWKLEGPERAYEHFGPPFLLNSTALYQRVRNVQLRILPQDELLPVEVSKYDQRIVLEALHNCIAHQDYSRNGRVLVTEMPDRLIFENEGSFFEGRPDEYVAGNRTPRRYRNPFLTQAMTELNMIDTMGYGIHTIYKGQVSRYLPLPDYDLGDPNSVKMTVYGGVVDPAYSRMLMQRSGLDLLDVLSLDRVQKQLPIPDAAAARLRKAKLIEGRKPHYHVSAIVAAATGGKAQYIRTRAQDDEFYAKLLIDLLQHYRQATREEVNQLLYPKLSELLTEEQKYKKVAHLLTKLRRAGRIRNDGSRGQPLWVLAE